MSLTITNILKFLRRLRKGWTFVVNNSISQFLSKKGMFSAFLSQPSTTTPSMHVNFLDYSEISHFRLITPQVMKDLYYPICNPYISSSLIQTAVTNGNIILLIWLSLRTIILYPPLLFPTPINFNDVLHLEKKAFHAMTWEYSAIPESRSFHSLARFAQKFSNSLRLQVLRVSLVQNAADWKLLKKHLFNSSGIHLGTLCKDQR